MSYRSLKRVLGETNLERKCRFLFGICLLLLIGGAFWWVDSVAENLVIETTRSKGRDLTDILMLKSHLEYWDTQGTDEQDFAKTISEDLKATNYQYEVFAKDDEPPRARLHPRKPRDDKEKSILLDLRNEFAVRAAEIKAAAAAAAAAAASAAPAGTNPAGQPLTRVADERELPPVFAERRLPAQNEYHYFEPIRLKRSCHHCHQNLLEGALSATDSEAFAGDAEPIYVVKVVIPYKEIQAGINQTRAILIAVAILTVFISMIALYVIVRYVIVKPLKHLRDVSDDISRGKTELRAELNTGDEFEELAASFNRMLRHLIDAQGELRQVNSDLDAKVDQLAQLNMRLYEMNQIKSDFLANMSHELRTPLNSIIGFSEVLQGLDSLSDKQRRYAENIQKSGRVLLEMINDILDLAKMEAGKMDVRPSEFRIDGLVATLCDMVRSLTEEKNIDLSVSVPADAPPLYQDQVKVQQILTNLLSNAIKFTPEGGRIVVAARRDEQQRLELSVADTGVGIAAEDRDVIFEKFRQGPSALGRDTLTREYSGTGLGLSIVKELCKLLGGEVSFESELGKGSTFRVVMPWTRANATRREAQLHHKLDDLAKPHRSDFMRPVATSELSVASLPSIPAVADAEAER